MAWELNKKGGLNNRADYEFICDSTSDLQNINTSDAPMGSVAYIIEPSNGVKLYMLNSSKQWIAQ